MLLSQQAELVSFNSKEVEIGISPNWENMIKSRKVVIENALRKISGDPIKIKFSTRNIIKSTSNSLNEQSKIPSKQKYDSTSKEVEKNISTENNQKNKEDYSPKNLANFFNGEIIDLND